MIGLACGGNIAGAGSRQPYPSTNKKPRSTERGFPAIRWNGSRPTAPLEQEAIERSGPRHMPESGQGFLLDLPDALARNPEPGADLLEREGLRGLQAEIQPEYQ